MGGKGVICHGQGTSILSRWGGGGYQSIIPIMSTLLVCRNSSLDCCDPNYDLALFFKFFFLIEWSAADCLNQNKLAVYQLSNRRKTATKVFPDCSKVLRSKTMSYRLDTALVLKIDETGDSSNGDGIGLTTGSFDFSNARQVLQCPGSVSINSKGIVYVNGVPMTTRLPPFKRGSVVVFEASRVSKEKLRVSITMDDKLVTFDWQVDDPCDGFYFAMGFQHSGWQISV